MIVYAVAIYFIIGAILALKYFCQEGKYERPLDGIAIAAIVLVIGPVAIVYLTIKNMVIWFKLWKKKS